MKTQTLIQWSGLLVIIAAVLLVLFELLRRVNLFLLAQTSSLLGLMLFVLAVMGVYAAQHKQSGGLGFGAFVLSVLGAMLVSTSNLISIAGERGVVGAQAVLDFYSSTVPLSIIAILCFLGGLFLLRLVTMRAGVLPRWAGIVLSIGALMVFVGFLALDPLTLLGFLLIGAALVWMGYALWSSKGEITQRGA